MNSYPIRVAKMFKEDLRRIKVKQLERGISETEVSPSKITERISRNPLWKQIVKEETGEPKLDFDLRR